MNELPDNGGMGGSGRMHDPSEAEHDRVRRRWMNIAFVVIVSLSIVQWWLHQLHNWDWLEAALLAIAAAPLGLGLKAYELRFKMSHEERDRVLAEIPKRQRLAVATHLVLVIVAFGLSTPVRGWGLWGIWLYDFVTYYHDRPERMRHLYAITKTLDEVRDFPMPWAWAVPAIVCELIRRG